MGIGTLFCLAKCRHSQILVECINLHPTQPVPSLFPFSLNDIHSAWCFHAKFPGVIFDSSGSLCPCLLSIHLIHLFLYFPTCYGLDSCIRPSWVTVEASLLPSLRSPSIHSLYYSQNELLKNNSNHFFCV